MLRYIPLRTEERSKEQLQSDQSSSGTVPRSIKAGEKLNGRVKCAEAFGMERWGARAFAGLMVAARYSAGGLTLVQASA